jgi:hypothetical protein
MRRLFTIVAFLGLPISFCALAASAGTVDYTVVGTYATGAPFTSTLLSNPGDSFTFTFSFDSALLGPGPIPGDFTGDIPIPGGFNYTDSFGGTTIHSLTGQAGSVNFVDTSAGGLFDLDFSFGGDAFTLMLCSTGSTFDCLDGTDPGFIDGTPPALNTGMFTIEPGGTGANAGFGSIFADDDTGDFAAIASGTVTATPVSAVPEPSSLLLLGSGFLALGGFARKRVTTLFN